MAQGYKLVLRPSEPGNKESKKLYYAVSKSTGFTDLRRTVSSADVKAVLDNLNYILDLELQDGRIVQLGEFGNFRITVGSEGVEDTKKFTASMIRAPKIVFTPGFDLRETKKTMGYSLIVPEKEKSENPGGGSGEDDRPVIE